MKEFFATKYRIVPTYEDDQQTGFLVQKKTRFGCWSNALKPEINIVPSYCNRLTARDAYFKTKEEAMDFINSQKTML